MGMGERSEGMDNENNCGGMAYRSELLERLGWRLFPNAMPANPELIGARDGVRTRMRVTLSFLDRVRVLISGRCEILVRTETENVVGATATASAFSVRPPGILSRRGADFLKGE